jgi:hypothetical protein
LDSFPQPGIVALRVRIAIGFLGYWTVKIILLPGQYKSKIALFSVFGISRNTREFHRLCIVIFLNEIRK